MSASSSGTAICTALLAPHVIAAEQIRGVVTTVILDFDPCKGEKSNQKILIDFKNKKVTQDFDTGVKELTETVQVPSVRDNFVVSTPDFSTTGKVTFTATGSTASGMTIMPNIDYKFVLTVDQNGKGAISGCHDGYPAYKVTVMDRTVYSFNHGPLNLIKLFGDCDKFVTPVPKPF